MAWLRDCPSLQPCLAVTWSAPWERRSLQRGRVTGICLRIPLSHGPPRVLASLSRYLLPRQPVRGPRGLGCEAWRGSRKGGAHPPPGQAPVCDPAADTWTPKDQRGGSGRATPAHALSSQRAQTLGWGEGRGRLAAFPWPLVGLKRNAGMSPRGSPPRVSVAPCAGGASICPTATPRSPPCLCSIREEIN